MEQRCNHVSSVRPSIATPRYDRCTARLDIPPARLSPARRSSSCAMPPARCSAWAIECELGSLHLKLDDAIEMVGARARRRAREARLRNRHRSVRVLNAGVAHDCRSTASSDISRRGHRCAPRIPSARGAQRRGRRRVPRARRAARVLPRVSADARLHRNRHVEDRRVRHRRRHEPLPDQVLRSRRVPRAEPAVLQGARRRGFEKRVRNRARLPRRAARELRGT